MNKVTEVLNDKDESIDEELDYFKFTLSKLNKPAIQKNESRIENEKINGEFQENPKLALNQYGIDYFEFENRFRGSCKKIKETQAIYLKYFNGKANILDIGCGRGEFLELLKENNISAKGIDVCKDFVDYCEYKKLDALLDDAVSHISKVNDNSIGGVFMSQVAEHLETEYLIELISKIYDKLENGAYFIAETPNPTMLSTFSNSFYLDPSHKNPVHPETFKFILEKAGFKEIEIVYTDSSKIQYNLPLLDGSNINNLEEFNNGVNLLSGLLFGSQDYAIIARK
ncbi:methionine biosynthesis protein MetW [Clostridium sp. BL-8]|nr:methionine biosynthesis protein MetW [Clostridium sp. BL-8]